MPKPAEPEVDWTKLTEDELAAGLVLLDALLFRLYFFSDDLSEELSLEQKLMMCDESERVLLCTARKIAKTVHIEATICQVGMTYFSRGVTEALCFTPSDVHLKPILTRLWDRLERMPILNLCVTGRQRGSDDTTLSWYGGIKWYFRIEGLSGRDTNMVGLRARFIVGDELAFGNQICHNSRLTTALPHARWLYAGVPNGVRSTPFYALDTALKLPGWSRHKYPVWINPIYQTPEAREQLLIDYKGENTQGWKNNVEGLWGEETVSSFPPGSIAVREMPYHARTLERFRSDYDLEMRLPILLSIPAASCTNFALGWDYGHSPDPSVIVGAYTRGDDTWNTYFRINLISVPLPHQIHIVRYLIANLFVGAFAGISSDHLGAIQDLQALDRERELLYYWANPGGTFKTTIAQSPAPAEDEIGQAVIAEDAKATTTGSVGNKEHYNSFLREWMLAAVVGLAGRKLWLAAADTEVTEELAATTEQKTPHGHTIFYAPPDPNNNNRMTDHRVETLRYLCDAIERGSRTESSDESYADMIAAMGWVGKPPARGWKPGWH